MSIVEDAGEKLFAEFSRVLPLAAKGPKRASPETVAAGLNSFFAAASAERQRYRMGLLSRARVALYLQQRLLGAGYQAALVRQVLFSMLLAAFVGERKR